MERRWSAAPLTPWGDIRGCPIENAKAALLRPHLAGVRSVIDLGCGGGDFLSLVAPASSLTRAVGIDCAPGALARARASGLYTELHDGVIEQPPDEVAGPFDLVMLSEVLYYVPDPRAALEITLDRFVGPHTLLFIALAVGRGYFTSGDVRRARALLARRGLVTVLDATVDYRVGLVPKRSFGPLFTQTHKAVMAWRRQAPR
jgi:SAM-dependent methyltransferase